MEKINLVELLKDCPKGMELDCAMYENVTLLNVDTDDIEIYPIKVVRKDGHIIKLTEYGQYLNRKDAKCIIFPKGKTTWEGFVPPCKFKDGDIVYIKTKGYNHNEFIIIFKEIKNDHIHKHTCFAYQVLYTSPNAVCHLVDIEEIRIATEEEKQKLFDAIKDNGYKWNAETKTLENIKPKFKVGDRIRHKNDKTIIRTINYIYHDSYGLCDNHLLFLKEQDNYELVPNKLVKPRFKVGDRIKTIYGDFQYDIKELTDTHYTLVEVEYKYKYTEPIIEDKYWELVPNKFDINALKPFDKVLVRDNNEQKWIISFFSDYYNGLEIYKYYCINSRYAQCIPYEGNEHLLGKTDECDEYYKTWNN